MANVARITGEEFELKRAKQGEWLYTPHDYEIERFRGWQADRDTMQYRVLVYCKTCDPAFDYSKAENITDLAAWIRDHEAGPLKDG